MVGGPHVLKPTFPTLENAVSVVSMRLLAGGVGGVGDRQVLGQLGRWAGGVAAYLHADGGATGRGARTALKSWPSTTWTSWPIPVTRSIFDWPNTAATVAAACSLPGEKHCGGQQRTRVVVRSHHVEAVPLELIGGGGGQTGLAGRVRDLHCDLFWRGRRNLLVLNLVGQTCLRRLLVVVGGVDGVLPRRWAL